MTLFDYVAIGILALSTVLGLWRGVVGEVISLAAWALAFFSARSFGGFIGQELFAGLIGDPSIRVAVGWAVVFIGVLVVMGIGRMAMSSMVKAVGLGLSDRILGFTFGALRGGLILMVLVAAAGLTSIPSQTWWKSATLSAPLETAVMAASPWLPQDISKRIRFR